MPTSTTLVEYAPGCAERALNYHGMEPDEILGVSQQEDVLVQVKSELCTVHLGQKIM